MISRKKIESEKKSLPQACTACKRRKIKCSGNPCTYCIKKNYVCEFDVAKKRGPSKKFKLPKVVQECDTISVVLLNHIQSSLEHTNRINNFVEFYFQYLGRAIPKEFKQCLLSSSDDPTTDTLTQLYIISAHVMKFCGNKDVELQCIEKAQRNATSLFNCDNVHSGISLMMMACYLGTEDPKFNVYVNLAHNIMKLPLVCKDAAAEKAQYACGVLLALFDTKLSPEQKYRQIVETLLQNEEMFSGEISTMDRVMVLQLKLRYKLISKRMYDDSNMSAFVASITAPVLPLTGEDYLEMNRMVIEMDEWTSTIDDSTSNQIYCNFGSMMFRFIVEWRFGRNTEAHMAALNVQSFYKNNKHVLGLWYHNSWFTLSLLPYYFLSSGFADIAHDILLDYESSVNNKQKLFSVWKEICQDTGLNNISSSSPIYASVTSFPHDIHSLSAPSSPSLPSSYYPTQTTTMITHNNNNTFQLSQHSDNNIYEIPQNNNIHGISHDINNIHEIPQNNNFQQISQTNNMHQITQPNSIPQTNNFNPLINFFAPTTVISSLNNNSHNTNINFTANNINFSNNILNNISNNPSPSNHMPNNNNNMPDNISYDNIPNNMFDNCDLAELLFSNSF